MGKIWVEASDKVSSDDIAGAASVLQGDGICVRAIHLCGDGHDLVVSVEFLGAPGQWVEVIREGTTCQEPHAISHIVEALGIRRCRHEPAQDQEGT